MELRIQISALLIYALFASQLPAQTGNFIKVPAQRPVTPLSFVKNELKLEPDYSIDKIRTEKDSRGNRHETYQVFFKGIPAEHQQLNFHYNAKGLYLVNGFRENIAAVTASRISATAARSVIGALPFCGAAEEKKIAGRKSVTCKSDGLMLHKMLRENTAQYLPAYRFDVFNPDSLKRYWFYIDAATGKLVDRIALLCSSNATGSADTRYSGNRTIQTEQNGSTFYLHDLTRGNGIFTYNLDASNNISDFTDNDNNWSAAEFHNASGDDGALDAHFGAQQTYDYWLSVHGRNSYDNNGAAITSYIHYGAPNLENAFWTGSEIMYAGGNNPFSCLDICGHEMGHAITEHTSQLVYAYEPGALNEGFSDIWGACVEYYAAPAKATWLIGEDVVAGGFRSMSNPNLEYQPDTYNGLYWYNGYGDNGGVHTNSGVLNFWFYLLSAGGSGTNDHAFSYVVSPIGMASASKIAYQCRFYLTPTSQFADARNATIQAAIDLYGSASNELTQVKNAWDAVGLYQNTLHAPFGLLAAPASASSVNLSWSDTNAVVSGYIIERSFSPQFYFAAIDTVPAGVSTYTDNTGQTNMLLYYRVRAYLNAQTSTPGNETSVLLSNAPVINIHNGSDITCNALFMDDGGSGFYSDSKHYTLTIFPATPGNQLYVDFSSFDLDMLNSYDHLLIYNGNSAGAGLIGDFTGNKYDTTYGIYAPQNIMYASDTNPTGALTFEFISDGYAAEPGWAAEVGCIQLPAKVTDLAAVSSGLTAVNLSWTDAAVNETGYVIERSNDLGLTYQPIDTTLANVTAYTDPGLASNAVYYYRIRPYLQFHNSSLYSSYSNIAIDTLGTLQFVKVATTFPQLSSVNADWGDFDNDGDLDLALSGITPTFSSPVSIYRNVNGNFVDINAGLVNAGNRGSVKWGDYDNDGDLDLLVSGAESNIAVNYTKVYKNDHGVFTDINAALPGTWESDIDWGDYDNDGDLDIVIQGFHIGGTVLYKNNAGTFSPVTISSSNTVAYNSSATWVDVDSDGDLDLFQTGGAPGNPVSRVCVNNAGTFSVQNLSGSFVYGSAGDYDNDGDPDLLLNNNNATIDVIKNTGAGFAASGFNLPGAFPAFTDYDNDGDLDIFAKTGQLFGQPGSTICYRNNNGSYVSSGINYIAEGGYTSFADYDNDGDQDMLVTGSVGTAAHTYITALYRNELIQGSPAQVYNNAPQAPSGLSVTINNGDVDFHWNKSADTETTQNGLNYNLRVGTSTAGSNMANGVEVCSPASATLSGYRQKNQLGNVTAYPASGNYPVKCLDNGTYYWSVQAIDHGLKGSAFAAEQSFTVTNGRPAVLSLVPVSGTVNVDTANSFVIYFSNAVTRGTGFIYIKEYFSNTIVQSYNVLLGAQVSISGNVVTLPNSHNLAANTRYYFDIPSTAFYNPCGYPYAGTLSRADWNFTTLCAANSSMQSVTICQGQSYTIGNSTYTAAGNYTDTINGVNACDSIVHTTLNVNPGPAVIFQAFNPAVVCQDAGQQPLPAGSPAGGTYSGTGVSGAFFDPAVSGVGTYSVSYTSTNSLGCSTSASQLIVVNACTALNGAPAAPVVAVGPNPAAEYAYISCAGNAPDASLTYKLYNVYGSLAGSGAITSELTKISFAQLAAGIYTLVMVKNGEPFHLQKIIHTNSYE